MTSSKDEADKIFKAFNEANAHIKFEIEHPSSGTAGTNKIALLDFQIEIDDCGDQTFSFYKKGAKSPSFHIFDRLYPSHPKWLVSKMRYNAYQKDAQRAMSAQHTSVNSAQF